MANLRVLSWRGDTKVSYDVEADRRSGKESAANLRAA